MENFNPQFQKIGDILVYQKTITNEQLEKAENQVIEAIASISTERLDEDNNEKSSELLVGDSPALMVHSPLQQRLYVSRMMPMNGMGNMMPSSESNIIQAIHYSSIGLDDVEGESYAISSPAPHGLAISDDGSQIFTASNTADWLYKINTETDEISISSVEVEKAAMSMKNDSAQESSIEKLADAFFEPKNDETKDD